MERHSVSGIVLRALRGVLAMVVLAACSGPANTTESLTNTSPDPDEQGVAALQRGWALVSLQEVGGTMTDAPEGRFVADFGLDGDLYIQADCNVCSAAYSAAADGSVEVIGPFPCTLAWCTSAPLDARYLSLLESARSWSVGDETLELSSAKGVLVFNRTTG